MVVTPSHDIIHQVILGLLSAVFACVAGVEVHVAYGGITAVEGGVGVDGVYKVCITGGWKCLVTGSLSFV